MCSLRMRTRRLWRFPPVAAAVPDHIGQQTRALLGRRIPAFGASGGWTGRCLSSRLINRRPGPPGSSVRNFASVELWKRKCGRPDQSAIHRIAEHRQPGADANSPGLYINDPYANPTPDFSQVPGSGTPADCTAAFSLVPGGACNLSVEFDPQSSGAIKPPLNSSITL